MDNKRTVHIALAGYDDARDVVDLLKSYDYEFCDSFDYGKYRNLTYTEYENGNPVYTQDIPL